MTIAIRPADTFEDVRQVLGPKRPDANVCWCLSYRLAAKENNALRGPARGERVAELCAADPPPGILAYDDGEPAGWAAVAPRSETSFARSTKIPHLDDLPVWSVWCIRIRPGHRRKGLTHRLVTGAIDFARSRHAPALEAYPIDSGGAKVDQTMAYAGILTVFEKAGFQKASDTDSKLSGFPRVLMRYDLR